MWIKKNVLSGKMCNVFSDKTLDKLIKTYDR